MPGPSRRLLILGGTAEAVALAEMLVQALPPGIDIVTSLAGRTEHPHLPPGEVRIGGFGGKIGLAGFLAERNVALVVDATHPFATQIAANAEAACAAAGVPLLRLARPAWERQDGDRWVEVEDAAAAASLLPGLGRRVFLTVGSRALPAFSGIADTWFLVRLIDPPKARLQLNDYEIVLGRGPFTLESERALLARHDIDVVIAKASGGGATAAKLIAAREAHIPVILLRRPAKGHAETVATPAAALTWIRARLQS
ncbi:MAG: cobalt-precorrin-6A reductase [Rhodospirillaceae bacterium]|nr:cobalt-precorrin-6A reductase [Rhodospirillaceae bacterium]